MILARVIGNVVATQKNHRYENARVMLCQQITPEGEETSYSVLALGDSTYEEYCEAGKRIDRRLEELGATRLRERIDCDIDYEEQAASWSEAVVERLARSPWTPACAGVTMNVGRTRCWNC